MSDSDRNMPKPEKPDAECLKQPEDRDELAPEERTADSEADAVVGDEATAESRLVEPISEEAVEAAAASIRESLVSLGFVAFDPSTTDNTSSGVMVAEERRKHFRRDVYVGVRDDEQDIEFLGRVVEGPFHAPHEVSPTSSITRATLLHPDRVRFRPTYYVYGTIEILGQIAQGERVIPTTTRPRPYSEIYIFPPYRLQEMLGIAGDFYLGHLMGYTRVPVYADVESKNFLPRNVGIFGTIGSGKSNSVQVIMEEAVQKDWTVIAIDVEGEYVRMNEPTDDDAMLPLLHDEFGLEPLGLEQFEVFVPSSGRSEAENPHTFKVPMCGLEAEVIADILELSEPQVRMFGTLTAAARRQSQGRRPPSRRGSLDTHEARQSMPYTLQNLIDGLDEDTDYPLLRGTPRGHEVSTAAVLRGKLIHLGRSGMLDWNATERVPYLPIDELLVPGRLSVLDVSETDDRSRNIAISFVLQSLFDRVIQAGVGEAMPNGRLRPRVLVVIEEIHTFVSRASAPRMRSVIDQLQIISRRGRKRWMALALVSQQPGHVPDELFELTNTRVIHQLKSTSNLAPVKQTTGGVHEALWSTVPALGPGQCLLTGAMFRNPLFVTMRPACSRRLLIG
jgi:DNA helicase HerA-like ATPase